MRTITLELLRHGPAHNQLISPLTQYLALCENHSAVTVNLPFEHNQVLHRLRSLSYLMGEEPRQFQVRDTAQAMGELLGRIPGLTADVNRQGGDIMHLRLVLSASELALLPFELAVSPPGWTGAGQYMLLQPHIPLCITRETRRVSEDFGEWPSNPRVLVVIASPKGYQPVPAGAHLLALRKALEPWVGSSEMDDEERRHARVARHLTVITDASIEAIERACAAERYTHVHILAHGQEFTDVFDTRFGLALHASADPQGPPDIVTGERLATALRISSRNEPGKLSRPTVVTLATCNGSNVGSVAGIGASVAHALHEAGIPVVIASQFPLSFGGSVRFVEILYEGFLWGEDPRRVLVDLRRCLHAEFPATHDWASITAYSSLPPAFEEGLADVQIKRTMANINVALGFADDVMGRFSMRLLKVCADMRDSAEGLDSDEENARLLDAAKPRVKAAKDRLTQLLQRYPERSSKIRGYLASTEKREAGIEFQISRQSKLGKARRQAAFNRSMSALESARMLYWEAYLSNRRAYWAVVQYLSLTLVLARVGQTPPRPDAPGQDVEALWYLAEVQSLHDARNASQAEREWALANLVELYVIAPMIPGLAVRLQDMPLAERVRTRAAELGEVAGARAFEVFSTRQQLVRYLEWYSEIAPELPEEVTSLANVAIKALPACEGMQWRLDTRGGMRSHGLKLTE